MLSNDRPSPRVASAPTCSIRDDLIARLLALTNKMKSGVFIVANQNKAALKIGSDTIMAEGNAGHYAQACDWADRTERFLEPRR